MTILKKETKDNNRVELTIRVEEPEWQKALDDAYQANRDLYPVDGCAPGKATRRALEQAYAPDVFYQEAVNETFPGALVEAIAPEEILMAAPPELRNVDIGPDGYTFTALAELYPEVKLGKYKGLAAPMPQAELSNDDVDKAESEWLQAHLVEEERDRAAMGDEVTLDFDGSVDGVPFDGGKAENYPLLLGSGMFIDGFEEQVAGIRPEEEREIQVTFPPSTRRSWRARMPPSTSRPTASSGGACPSWTDAFATGAGLRGCVPSAPQHHGAGHPAKAAGCLQRLCRGDAGKAAVKHGVGAEVLHIDGEQR